MTILLKNLIESKVKTLSELKEIKRARGGQVMVFVSGCFDIVHADHIEYLAWGKSLGNYLVVAINNDTSVKKLKGADRPINYLKNRVEVIAANYFTDYIIVFNELNTVKIIKALKPDIFARGKNLVLGKKEETKTKKEINQNERQAVESYGGKIRFLEKTPRYSSTWLAELIRK